MSTIWWENIKGVDLSQGDYLENCPVIIIPDDPDLSVEQISDVIVEERNLIIMTQSCDLAQNKAKSIAMCPIYTLDELSKKNPSYLNNRAWEPVRQGRVEGWHMLGGFLGFDNSQALVVDFRQIYSLPVNFLRAFVSKSNKRARLKSPYLEHTAQSFARFFMRVGLPTSIDQFK